MSRRVVVTAAAAITAAGASPGEIWERVRRSRSAIGPIRQWDASTWPRALAGEVSDFDPRRLVEDRKVHKWLRRSDFLGLHAAKRAIEAARLLAAREALEEGARERFADRTAVWVGSGGSGYRDQYEFFPLLAASAGDLRAFGRELEDRVNPMWLLRSLPNNVLCHVGIRYDFKGPNGCFTNHSVSGLEAVAEAFESIRSGDADRAVAIAHDAPVEPETIAYYDALGLLATDAIRPFDRERNGTILGEGAGALVLEAEDHARSRGAEALGEVLGAGRTSEAEGLLSIRADGDGLARAIAAALEDAGLEPRDVGMIVAHANGTRQSDASEAVALRAAFGSSVPPVTGFKWAFGHLLAASGAVDVVLALLALRDAVVPGLPTLRDVAEECAGLPVSAAATIPRSPVALVVTRGFGGTSAALLVRAGPSST